MREYDSINPKVRNPIMDRSYSVMAHEQAHAVMLGEGYDQVVIEMLERWSAGTSPDFGTGYTHVPNGPNDHYWRLIVADGIWYFQYVDYSPRANEEVITQAEAQALVMVDLPNGVDIREEQLMSDTERQAQRAADLEAALLRLRFWSCADGPCWCPGRRPDSKLPHTEGCQQAREALRSAE